MRILLVLLTTAVFASAEQSPSDFMKSWVEDYNKNDSAKITAYYDRSEHTECLISAGLWIKGYENIRKMYQQDMKEVRFYDSKSEEMKHRVLGNVALVSFVHRFKYALRQAPEHYRIHIRTTVTLKKEKDSWKIISEHSSAIKGITRAEIIAPD